MYYYTLTSHNIALMLLYCPGKLPIQVEHDAQQVFTTIAPELPQHHESTPPLPPKPQAE